VRFVLDHDVSVRVCSAIARARHQCWRAPLPGATSDDDIAIYADDKRAALISHDYDLATRRRRLWFGRHVRLDCAQPRAEEVVSAHIELMVSELARAPVVIAVSEAGVRRLDRLWS